MRRIQRHYQKEIRQRMFIFIGGFVFIVILFFTIGFPLLLNGSVKLSELFSGKKDNSDQRNPLIQSVEIDDIPEFTNKDQITISGRVSNFDKITIYVNDSKVKEESVPSSGEFSTNIGGLKKGDNDVYVEASSKTSSKRSDSHKVTYRADKPKLDIKEPNDGSKTNHDEIKVAGATDKDIYIKVNDLPIVTDANNNFQTSVKLTEGENKIKITASDAAGNSEEKTITIKYEKD